MIPLWVIREGGGGSYTKVLYQHRFEFTQSGEEKDLDIQSVYRWDKKKKEKDGLFTTEVKGDFR